MAATADYQNHPPNCMDDPNFATICSFFENFGETCHLGLIPFDRLQAMLEDTTEVAQDLVQIHILLLRRIYKSINTEKWEKHLAKFCHSYNSQDGWEVERFGYKKSKIQTKLRVLKNLMESQFDYNIKFKNEVNKLTADTLRRIPLGRDSEGQLYWYQVDAEANLRIYREDVDDDTWELVATSREQMTELIQQLSDGIVHKNSVESDNGGDGDSTPKDDILMDTGAISDKGSSSESSSDEEDAMAIDEDAASAGEDMEVDLKAAQSDKMNTSELGKAVRQMLDNSTSVEEMKIPEIKQEDKEVPSLHGSEAENEHVAAKDEEMLLEVVDRTEQDSSEATKVELNQTVQDTRPSTIHEGISEKQEETVLSKEDLKFPEGLEVENRLEEVRKNVQVEMDVSKVVAQDVSREEVLDREIQGEVSAPVTSEAGIEIQEAVLSPPPDVTHIHDKSTELLEADLTNSSTGDPTSASPSQLSVPEDLEPADICVATESETILDISQNEEMPILSEDVPVSEGSVSPLEACPNESMEISTTGTTEAEIVQSSPDVARLDATCEPSSVDEAEISDPSQSQYESSDKIYPQSEMGMTPSISDLDDLDPVSVEESASEVKVPILEQSGCSVIPASELGASQRISADFEQLEEHFSPVSSDDGVSEGEAQVSHVESQKETPDLLPMASETETGSILQLEVTDDEVPCVVTGVALSEMENSFSVADPATLPPHAETEGMDAQSNNLEMDVLSPISEITFEDAALETPTKVPDVSTGIEANNISDNVERNVQFDEESPSPQLGAAEHLTHSFPLVSKDMETLPVLETKLVILDQAEAELKDPEAEFVAQSLSPEVTPAPVRIEETLEYPIPIQQLSQVWNKLEFPSGDEQQAEDKVAEPAFVPEGTFPEVTTEPMEFETSEAEIGIAEPEVETREEIPKSNDEINKTEFDQNETETAASAGDPPAMTVDVDVNSPLAEAKSPVSEVVDESTEQIPVAEEPPEQIPVIEETPEQVPVVEELFQKSTAWITEASDLKTTSSICVPSNNEASISESLEEIKIPSPIHIPEQTPPSPQAPISVQSEKEEKVEKTPVKPLSSGLLGLVGYDDSSEEEEDEQATLSTEVSGKRRAESPGLENPSKCSKMDDGVVPTSSTVEYNKEFNPIVGETIEEEMVLIIGEGSGAELEGGNSPIPTSLNNTAESIEEDESSMDESPVTKKGPGRPRGRKPGSGNAKRPPKRAGRKGKARSPEKDESDEGSPSASMKKRVNGRLSTEIPTRQSSRIAKIQEKEEEERRRLEEQRLAQLKAAQLKKQERQLEREQKQQSKESGETEAPSRSKSRGKGRPPKSESKYLPTPSETESEDEDLQTAIQQSKKRGRKRKHIGEPRTLMKKGLNPWVHSSSEEDDEAVEEEEEEHDVHEEEEEEVRSDHEFSPESDMGEDDDASPSRHARTVKRGETKEDKYAETNCSKCGKGDHPEWILLCDSCDAGFHASCLRPVTWVIPEGSWFCPPCQHKMLIEKLNENLEEYDKVVKKHELEVLRKQRLAFVGISLDNVLPQQDEGEKPAMQKKKKRRRLISSDESDDELMAGSGQREHFIDERENSSNLSKYNSEESEDEPMYKLRARRATKSFDFKEYDELINSALRDEDEYEVAEEGEAETAAAQEQTQENGDAEENEPPPPKLVVSKGKVMPGTSDGEEEEEAEEKEEDSASEHEEIDEGEKKRRQELEKQSHRKTRRRLNDLDAASDEDSDEDFKGSDDEDEDEDEAYAVEDEDSEWSGDREGEESDDSIAKRGKKGKLGRQEKYLDVGSVRRSSRKARSRVVYDESDQESDADEPAGGWGSENESGASTASESEDETWGKKKKKKVSYNPPSKLRKSDFLFNSNESNSKSKSKASPKKKKKKVDEDETDRAWSKHGGKVKKGDTESSNKRSTRGKQIDFKVILDSGESDDDGNIHPKRVKPVVPDYENDSEEPSSSKQLVAELNAAQAAAAAKSSASKVKNSKPRKRKPSAGSPNRKPSTSASPAGKSPTKKKVKNLLSSSEDSAPETDGTSSKLAEQLLKPIPAPPIPPNLAKRLSTSAVLPSGISVPLPQPQVDSRSQTPPPQVPSPSPTVLPATQPPLMAVSQPSTNLMMSEILASSGSKKQNPTQQQPFPRHPTPPPSSPGLPSQIPAGSPGGPRQLPPSTIPTGGGGGPPMMFPPGKLTPPHRGLSSPPHQAHALLPPSEISRVPNPAYYPPNQGMRLPWDRNLGPPPYQGRGPPPQPMVKSPPLNNSPYSPGGGPRSGYVPPLRIPNPSGSGPPLQSFQQFKREPPGPGPQMMYRMPPQGNGGGRGIPPPNILAHLQSSHERFFGPHGGFGGPPAYGIPPPGPLYSTTQPQQFDYRHEDSEFKEEVSQSERRSSPLPPSSKEENKSDGEFGGLVSYFSSQRGEEDMDT